MLFLRGKGGPAEKTRVYFLIGMEIANGFWHRVNREDRSYIEEPIECAYRCKYGTRICSRRDAGVGRAMYLLGSDIISLSVTRWQ